MGINYYTPKVAPGIASSLAPITKDCYMVSNMTAINGVFAKLSHQFDMMYSKRAFVHWLVREGAELEELTEAREGLAALERDYEEIACDA